MTLLELVMENFDARLVSDGKELTFACPLCADHKTRMFINLQTFRWICHNCGEAGSLMSFLERVLEKDPFEAYRIATKIQPRAERAPKTVAAPPPAVIDLPGQQLTDPTDMVQRGFWNYLLNERRISPESIAHYQMGYEIIGRYRGRVIIPIYQNRQLVSFAARSIAWWEHPKIMYPAGTKISTMLFGLDEVDGDEVVLVEGIFDVVPLQGYAAATFGAHLSAEQRALLHKKGIQSVTILWDADPAGWREAAKAIRELKSDGFDARMATLEGGLDPSGATEDDLTRALSKPLITTVELPRYANRKHLEEG